MTDSRPRVLFAFRPGRGNLIERHQQGESPRDMLYGMAGINPDEFAVSFIERKDSRWDQCCRYSRMGVR